MKIPHAPEKEFINEKVKDWPQIIEELDITYHKGKDYKNKLFFYENECIPSLEEIASELTLAGYSVESYPGKVVVGMK